MINQHPQTSTVIPPEPSLENYRDKFDLLLNNSVSLWPWADTYRTRAQSWGNQNDLASQLQAEFAAHDQRTGFWRWWHKPVDYTLKRAWYEHYLIYTKLAEAAGTTDLVLRAAILKELQNFYVSRWFGLTALPKKWFNLFQKIADFCQKLIVTLTLPATPTETVTVTEKSAELPLAVGHSTPARIITPSKKRKSPKLQDAGILSGPRLYTPGEKLSTAHDIGLFSLAEKFARTCGFLGIAEAESVTIAHLRTALNERKSALHLFENPSFLLRYREQDRSLKQNLQEAESNTKTLIAEAQEVLDRWSELHSVLTDEKLANKALVTLRQQGKSHYQWLQTIHKEAMQVVETNRQHRGRDYIHCCGFLGFTAGEQPDAQACFERLQELNSRLLPQHKLSNPAQLLMNTKRLLQKIFGNSPPYFDTPSISINNDAWLAKTQLEGQRQRSVLETVLTRIAPAVSSTALVTVAPSPGVLPRATPLKSKIKGQLVAADTWCHYWIARGWLGLAAKIPERGLTKEEIKAAFRQESLKLHPDKTMEIVERIINDIQADEKVREHLTRYVTASANIAFQELVKQYQVLEKMVVRDKTPNPQVKALPKQIEEYIKRLYTHGRDQKTKITGFKGVGIQQKYHEWQQQRNAAKEAILAPLRASVAKAEAEYAKSKQKAADAERARDDEAKKASDAERARDDEAKRAADTEHRIKIKDDEIARLRAEKAAREARKAAKAKQKLAEAKEVAPSQFGTSTSTSDEHHTDVEGLRAVLTSTNQAATNALHGSGATSSSSLTNITAILSSSQVIERSSHGAVSTLPPALSRGPSVSERAFLPPITISSTNLPASGLFVTLSTDASDTAPMLIQAQTQSNIVYI